MSLTQKKKAADKTEKTYQVRPAFKDKFRPQEAKERVEKIVWDKLKDCTFNPQEINAWTKEIADNVKADMKIGLGKDKRYKFLV